MKIFKFQIYRVHSTTHLFQVFLISISSLIISFLVYQTIIDFSSFDHRPDIQPIIPKQVEEIGTIPMKVKVGLYIYDFPKFNLISNEFSFRGLIFFEFDPALITLETIEKFRITRGEIKYKSEPFMSFTEDGSKIYVQFEISVNFKTDLNFRRFPFNDHSINIILDHELIAPEEIIFDSSIDIFRIDPKIYLPGWYVVNRIVTPGCFEVELEEYIRKMDICHSRVLFTVDCKRSGIQEGLSIFLPLLLIFFLAVFSLSIDPKNYYSTISSISIGSVTGMLAYKYVIDNISPNVGYFMLSDIIYFLLLGAVTLIFFINSRVYEFTGKQKAYISAFIYFFVIAAFIYLFKFWS